MNCRNTSSRFSRAASRIGALLTLATLFPLADPAAVAAAASQTPAPPFPSAQAPKEQGGGPAGAAQAPSVPSPIPVSMIALEAESVSIRVRRIKNEMDSALGIPDVESQLTGLTRSLQRFRPLLETGETPHVEELLNLRQELRRISMQLLKMQNNLTPRSQAIEARRDELLKMESLWKITFDELSRHDTPPATRELTLTVLRDIQAVLKTLGTVRPSLLTLQGQISEHRIAVDNLLAQTDAAISGSRARLFTLDSEPLWRAISSATLSSSIRESARDSYQRRALPLYEYLRDSKERLFAHLLITVVLILLLASVSRRSRTWFGPQDGVAQVLHHPVAAAAVLSLLLSFSIYPNAPITLYQLPLLLMMIPLLRLLSAGPARDERNILRFLAGIYLLLRLDEFMASDDFLHRIFLLVLTGTAILGACLAARRNHRATETARLGPWLKARRHLMRLAGLILLVSLIADIVGSVALSTLLAEACVSSAFAGAALFAGVVALEGYLIPLLRSPLARMSPAILNYREMFERRTSFLLRLAAVAIWIWTSLGLFGLSRPILDMVTPVLTGQLSFGQMTFSLRGILLFAVTIWLSALAARFTGFLIEEDIQTRLTLPQGIPATVSLLVRNSIIVLGFILALTGAGFQWSQITLIAGAIGVGVGLGLQNLVTSFVAGLILIFERPIRVGDAVEVGTITGVVTRIGLRSSTIQTYDGSEVICPNGNLITQALVNWTLSKQIRRVEVQVGTAYGTNPDTVLEILADVARKHPGVLQDPEPVALFKGFGDSSLNFVLRFFCSFSNWPVLSSEVGIRINDAFREAGIVIPFPQRDIRITSEFPETALKRNFD